MIIGAIIVFLVTVILGGTQIYFAQTKKPRDIKEAFIMDLKINSKAIEKGINSMVEITIRYKTNILWFVQYKETTAYVIDKTLSFQTDIVSTFTNRTIKDVRLEYNELVGLWVMKEWSNT